MRALAALSSTGPGDCVFVSLWEVAASSPAAAAAGRMTCIECGRCMGALEGEGSGLMGALWATDCEDEKHDCADVRRVALLALASPARPSMSTLLRLPEPVEARLVKTTTGGIEKERKVKKEGEGGGEE